MKAQLKRYLQEPLIYFLLIGGLFFIAFDYFGQSYVDDEQTIVVDKKSLLRFMQLKTKIVDPTMLVRAFDGLSVDKRQKLIDAYVREQALYRESKALGLDKGDPIIKRRAIQNLEFITQDYSEAVIKVTDKQIETFFSEHKQNYYIEPYVTFTHVFFDREIHKDDLAEKLALTKLKELNKNKVLFSEGINHGNRFPYHVNYVERTPDFVASHFGKAMAKDVFAISFTNDSPDEPKWQGPFASSYGSHLVMVTSRNEGRYPELEEIRDRVIGDVRRAQIRQQKDSMIAEIVGSYQLELDPEFETLMDR